jgi:hypothetical protein
MSRGLSPKLPISYHPSDGYTLNKTFVEMVKQNLKMLVLTNPGERVMIPQFGVGIKKYLFEPDSQDVFSEIEGAIRSQVSSYMPFVEVASVIFAETQENSSASAINVRIEFRIIPIDSISFIELSILP